MYYLKTKIVEKIVCKYIEKKKYNQVEHEASKIKILKNSTVINNNFIQDYYLCTSLSILFYYVCSFSFFNFITQIMVPQSWQKQILQRGPVVIFYFMPANNWRSHVKYCIANLIQRVALFVAKIYICNMCSCWDGKNRWW